MKTTLMFSYGANLSQRAMARRCPGAVPLGKFFLGDARLVFRGVADCAHEPGSQCPGALWEITPACELALDRFEGWRPDQTGLYRKEIVPLAETWNGHGELMYYAMNSTGIFPPAFGYLDVIAQGYRDFGLPLRVLRQAVKDSHDDKAPTYVERQRHRRKGRPALALRIGSAAFKAVGARHV